MNCLESTMVSTLPFRLIHPSISLEWSRKWDRKSITTATTKDIKWIASYQLPQPHKLEKHFFFSTIHYWSTYVIQPVWTVSILSKVWTQAKRKIKRDGLNGGRENPFFYSAFYILTPSVRNITSCSVLLSCMCMCVPFHSAHYTLKCLISMAVIVHVFNGYNREL